ncbi:MAG: TraB/GumN family protein [Myxococcota bacterium]
MRGGVLLLASALAFGCADTPDAPHPAADAIAATAPASIGRAAAADCAAVRVDASAALPSAAPAARRAEPPFYCIAGEGGADLLLLGTIHFGPPQGWTLSRPVRAGLQRADGFVLEVDLRREDPERIGDLLAELAVLGPGERLPDLVAPETAALLDARDATLTALGFPRGARDGRAPWYLATALVELPIEANGWSLAASLDVQVLGAAGTRPVLGLETAEEQLRMLAGLPLPVQDLMLRDTLARLDEATASLRALARAWQVGDEATLESLAREGVDALPGLDRLYEVLLDERNRRWLARLRPLLADPARAGQTLVVAVGALHLPGPEGLVALLRDAGYRASRIDQKDPIR